MIRREVPRTFPYRLPSIKNRRSRLKIIKPKLTVSPRIRVSWWKKADLRLVAI